MIVAVALFLLIIAISFILAFQSMKDYQEIPKKSTNDYGLFLVRRPENLNTELLESIRKQMLSEGLLVSIERLFKGSQSALTLFGPRKILDNFIGVLNLLELEDYTQNLDSKDMSVWEIGLKNINQENQPELNNLFNNLPALSGDDQFFWQITLATKKENELLFQTQIRAAVFSKDPERRRVLVQDLQNIGSGGLIKIPKPFSAEQMMVFYKLRSMSKDSKGPVLDSGKVLNLVRV